MIQLTLYTWTKSHKKWIQCMFFVLFLNKFNFPHSIHSQLLLDVQSSSTDDCSGMNGWRLTMVERAVWRVAMVSACNYLCWTRKSHVLSFLTYMITSDDMFAHQNSATVVNLDDEERRAPGRTFHMFLFSRKYLWFFYGKHEGWNQLEVAWSGLQRTYYLPVYCTYCKWQEYEI